MVADTTITLYRMTILDFVTITTDTIVPIAPLIQLSAFPLLTFIPHTPVRYIPIILSLDEYSQHWEDSNSCFFRKYTIRRQCRNYQKDGFVINANITQIVS